MAMVKRPVSSTEELAEVTVTVGVGADSTLQVLTGGRGSVHTWPYVLWSTFDQA
jgi:hypothetical protein